jgi:hypothetical protein
MWQYNYSDEMYHHGVKGMKWGVRRYQYTDGSLTPQGERRYRDNNFDKVFATPVKKIINTAITKITGKQYVDDYLSKGITLSRIQTSKNFEKFAFYATYKKQDMDKYMGLFGKNLSSRAEKDASDAEKKAKVTGNKLDISNAKELRNKANNTKVYQLRLEATKKLKIPSDENASNITVKLLKDKEFKGNLVASINDSKEKMRRPSQQILFNQAEKALKKDITRLTSSEKTSIYKAFNLSLVNHNQQEIAAQDRFYKELKKKGYNALLDYNDKEYSSYHAKRPMIIFDVDSVRLNSVVETNPKIVNKLHQKYNAERIRKEIKAETIGLLSQYLGKTFSDCQSYLDNRMRDYLEG